MLSNLKKFTSPCQEGCPVGTDVRGFLQAVTGEDYREAYRLIGEKNPFPSVCAWICPHPCEERCRRGDVDYALSIRALKRFAVEQHLGDNWKMESPLESLYTNGNFAAGQDLPGGDVAIVGAGPAGLAAAQKLACLGYTVTVLERQPAPGGHFSASIPLYRLPREAVRRDIQRIINEKILLVCGINVGQNITVTGLLAKYRAVIIAAGLQLSRNLPLPNFDHPGVLLALPFLQGVNLGRPEPIGQRVLVIGGGNVAMDVARTAIRLGAGQVQVTCLEKRVEMPAHDWEIDEALEEGVVLFDGWGPEEVLVEEGRLVGLRLKKVLQVFDAAGRFSPSFNEGVKETLVADTIIVAVGQKADLTFLAGSGLEPGQGGSLPVDRETLSTTVKGVFACGEVATGPGAAINAVASGRQAALAVDAYLSGSNSFILSTTQGKLIEALPGETSQKVTKRNRQPVPVLTAKERRESFTPFELGYSENIARQESARCMRCGAGAVVIAGKCAACLTCARLCPFGVPEVNGRAVISEQKCQGCGICASACPAGAIEMMEPLCSVSPEGNELEKGTCVGEAQIKLYICRYQVGKYFDPEIARHEPELSGIQPYVLPCVDSLNQQQVLQDLENGAPAVVLAACGEHGCLADGYTCRGTEFILLQKILEDIGMDPCRLQFYRAGENANMLQDLVEYVRMINKTVLNEKG